VVKSSTFRTPIECEQVIFQDENGSMSIKDPWYTYHITFPWQVFCVHKVSVVPLPWHLTKTMVLRSYTSSVRDTLTIQSFQQRIMCS